MSTSSSQRLIPGTENNVVIKLTHTGSIQEGPHTHSRVVTGSCQITEVKQRRARLVLGWVTGA